MVAQRKAETEERLMTEAEYLAFEERSRERHEFADGVLRLMSGTTGTHNEIVLNLVEKLRPLARKKKCRIRAESVKLRAHSGWRKRYYYPDFMVICAPRTSDEYTEEDPCFIVEVTSKSTKDVDRQEKLEAYLQLESLFVYAIIEQSSRKVEVFQRISDGWKYRLLEGAGVFDVPCLGATVTLEDVYAGLTLPELKRLQTAPALGEKKKTRKKA